MKKILVIGMLVVGFNVFGLDHGLISGFEVGYNFYNMTLITNNNRVYVNDASESISLKLITGYRIENLRVTGTYANTMLNLAIDNNLPIQDRYKIDVNYTIGNFKIGFSHYCDHPIIANNKTRNLYKDEIVRNVYVSYYREF